MTNPTTTPTVAEQLERLAEKATKEKLTDGGRYFDETCNDLTKCGHGDTGEYQNSADGKLIEALWNNLPTILTALRPPTDHGELVERFTEPFAWADGIAWHKPAHRAVIANVKLGAWMSAALDDPAVCDAMKADIREWFSAGEPMEFLGQTLSAHPDAWREGVEAAAKVVLEMPQFKKVTFIRPAYEDITSMGRPYIEPAAEVTREVSVTRADIVAAIRNLTEGA